MKRSMDVKEGQERTLSHFENAVEGMRAGYDRAMRAAAQNGISMNTFRLNFRPEEEFMTTLHEPDGNTSIVRVVAVTYRDNKLAYFDYLPPVPATTGDVIPQVAICTEDGKLTKHREKSE